MKKINAIIIEDNSQVLYFVKKDFKKSKKVSIVFEAVDGKEGMEKIEQYKDYIDVVILDLVMPAKDGIKVLEEMATLGIKKKVIVTTDFNSSDMIRRTSEMGVSYYVLKPYKFEDLEKIIIDVYNRKYFGYKFIDIDRYNIDERLTTLLHELGIPSHVKGYHYIKTSVILIIEDPYLADAITKKLYPAVANIHGTTAKNVERSIRHSIEMSFLRNDWEKIVEVFGNSIDPTRAKPTNAEFILTITDKIRMEMFD